MLFIFFYYPNLRYPLEFLWLLHDRLAWLNVAAFASYYRDRWSLERPSCRLSSCRLEWHLARLLRANTFCRLCLLEALFPGLLKTRKVIFLILSRRSYLDKALYF